MADDFFSNEQSFGEEAAFHVDNLEPPRQIAHVNLFDRLHEAEEAAKLAKKQPAKPVHDVVPPAALTPAVAASPSPSPDEPIFAGTADHPAVTSRLPIIVAAVVLVLALGGGTAGYLWTQMHKNQKSAVVESGSPKPKSSVKPSTRPSAKPTTKPTAPPPVAPKPPPAPTNTYTVQTGDSLITIGDKLRKDWRAIAAANGNISDPNLILPGQVLKIP